MKPRFFSFRLWDAVGGFLFLFANMQDKLSKHSSQLDLLKELLNLQKDMVIMMLSMLEGTFQFNLYNKLTVSIDLTTIFQIIGNVVNGTIGKQMVDTLVESASNVEVLIFELIFFNSFNQIFFSIYFSVNSLS